MMGAGALPQTQTGTAAILAALGSATPAASGKGGFEQLITALPPANPLSGVTPVTEVPALPAPTLNPVLSQAGPASTPVLDTDATAPPATEMPSATVAKPVESAPAPETDAAAAASLLISVATPRAATTAAKPTLDAADKSDTKADTENSDAAPAADTAVVTVAVPDLAQPTAPVAVAVAAAIVATASPAPEAPSETDNAAPRSAPATPFPDAARPTAKSAKADLAAPVRDDAAATPRTVKPDAAVALFADKPVPTGSRPSVDAGASMAVLFGQPATNGMVPAADIARAAPVTERLLDMGSDDQWIAQLAADIAATKSDKGDISFRLMPRHLGRLDVSMLTGDAGVTVKLDTQHEATAAIVQAAQPRLVEDLRQQGVRVAEAQVTHTPAETGRQQQQPQGQGRQGAPGTGHLIETAPERPGADREDRAADRRGRFA